MFAKKYLLLIAFIPTVINWWLSQPVLFNEHELVKKFNVDDIATSPFQIDISNEKIDHIKEELQDWKASSTSHEASTFFSNLTDVMLNFDWQSHQNYLNTFKHYRMTINKIDIHFIRSNIPPPKNARVVPLVLLHGFPGSFWDFYKMIPILSNPTRHGFDFGISKPIVFDVVIPSIPGFIFSSLDSDQYEKMDIFSVAGLVAELLNQLELSDYIIHGANKFGGDIAALVASVSPKAKAVHIANPYIDTTYSTKVWLHTLLDCLIGHRNCNQQDEEKLAFYDVTSDGVHEMSDSPIRIGEYLMKEWRKTVSKDENTKELHQLFTYDELATSIYLYTVSQSLPSALTIMHNTYSIEEPRCQIADKPVAISYSTQSPWHFEKDLLQHKFLNVTILHDNEERPIKGGLFHYIQDAHNTVAHIFSFAEEIFQ